MNFPFAAIVISYAAGLLLAEFFHPPLAVLFGVSFLALALVFALAKFRRLLIWPLLALAGWTNSACHTHIHSPHDLRALLPEPAELASVRGTLPETPSQRVFVRDEAESWRTLARLDARMLIRGNRAEAARGQILVTTPGKLPPEFFAGQEVEITGAIARPAAPLAEGLLDYRTFLERQGVYFQLKAASTNDWKLISTNTAPPLSDRFLTWAQAMLLRGLPGKDEPLKLLWAMTLGWQPALTSEVSAPFMQSGTMHVFAISGLHIALIAWILVAILRALQIPRLWCGAVIIPLIWFYTAATGWQPSAIRSTIMMTIVIAGWMLNRPGNLLNSLSAAAFIILIYDPLQLFQASFQLSFFVVLSIALVMRPLEKWRDRLLGTDPLLPRQLLPYWRRCLNAILRVVLTWLAVSIAAWLGSWPLCAYYFHIFSPVTLLANLLVVPLSSAALACNLGSLICGDWLPWLTELFNHSGWLWMWLMVETTHGLVKLPGAFFYVSGPTAADFVIYYGALFAALSGVAFRKKWRTPLFIGVLAAAVFYGWRWHDARQTTTLTVLPLNGGHAVFVQSGRSAENLLVDCGNARAIEFVTLPFLHAHGVNHVPRLALTQGDLRDMGSALEICEAFSIDEVFTSKVNFRSPTYRKTVDVLSKKPGRLKIVESGAFIGAWEVLHPVETKGFPQADDNALVLKGGSHGVKILLLSDLGRRGQDILASGTHDLQADIVVAGLPEKSQPLSEALLDKIRPKIIVVADSLHPATKRAPAALHERLKRRNIPVLLTGQTGAVTIVMRPMGWEIHTREGQNIVAP